MDPASTTATSNPSSIVSRLAKTHVVYHRMYSAPPPRSDLAISQLTDDGLPKLLPAPAAPTQRTLPPPTPPPAATTHPPTIRLICISDTHNSQPSVPAGDILLHAGDLTNSGSFSELQRAVTWLSSLPHELKIVVAGNHDGVTLDAEFLEQYQSYFRFPEPQSAERNRALFTEAGLCYLEHEERSFTLRDGRSVRVFGSPWTVRSGLWGFGYEKGRAEEVWRELAPGVDVLLCHGPPRFLGDSMTKFGCEALLRRVEEVRPRAVVCGHVHDGRGVLKVGFDEAGRAKVKEVVEEPSGKKWWKVPVKGTGGEEVMVVNCAHKGGLGRKAVVVDLEVGTQDGQGQKGLVKVRGVEGGWQEVGITHRGTPR